MTSEEIEVSIFKDSMDKNPHKITLRKAFDRIKSGEKIRELIDRIRKESNANARGELKRLLPSVTFSGIFSTRGDNNLIKHSGYAILDFDHVHNPEDLKKELFEESFVKACWISPSGDGVKALVRFKNPQKHLEHYMSLIEYYKQKGLQIDEKNKNKERLCYESIDSNLLEKDNETEYEGLIEQKTYVSQKVIVPDTDEYANYVKLKKWIEKKGEYFVTGNRNNFLMRLAAACNRFGISQSSTESYLSADFLHGSDFDFRELQRTVKSVYKNYHHQFNTSAFEKTEIIQKETKEVQNEKVFDCDMEIKDLIYFKDVYDNLEERVKKGISKGETTHFAILDNHFRWMRREVTVIGGMGNLGKTTMALQLMLFKSVFEGKKWAVFSPENSPADYFYQDVAEMYAGKLFDIHAQGHATDEERQRAKEFVNEHFFYLYPENDSPTPDYILKRFAEVIIKHKVDGVVIDPFNQLIHDRGEREDLYLEKFLTTTKRFAQIQDVFFIIIAHPSKPQKSGNKVYEEPDAYSLSGGAMWNHKADNILCYHRPDYYIDPKNNWCTFSSQRIKKQKLNGVPGKVNYIYDRFKCRFYELDSEPELSSKGYNPLDHMEMYGQKPQEQQTNHPIMPSSDNSYDDMPF